MRGVTTAPGAAQRSALERARASYLQACELDVAVRKPGNVSRLSAGHGMQAELFRAIRAAAGGRQYIDPALTHHLAASFAAQNRKRARADAPAVTERESEVLRLVSRGYSNKEIAARLYLSEKTVKHHMTNILQKLQVRNRVEAALMARAGGSD